MRKSSILRILLSMTIITFIISCIKEKENDPRLKYVGDWNFKGNGYSYSGYYIYDSLLNSHWTYNESFTTDYNDSTGSIELGYNSNEIVIKYCESCHSVIYNLNENGEEEWSDNYRANIGWTLTDTTFFKIVTPSPPSYSPSFSTYDVEGWKL
tara:strand:+ start:115 stop:573 length:459 start_codon:yes stop_codon:yes gene_type:complete